MDGEVAKLRDLQETDQRLARGRQVLEIGIWKGRSTVAMAATARHIVAVDHFRGDAFAGPANTCHSAWTNLCETSARDRVTMIVGAYSQLYDLAVDLRRFDLIHYDADHTYESTVDALNLISSGAAPHATLAIHDYDHNPNHAGVRRAVNEFVDRTGMRLRTVCRLAILESQIQDSDAHEILVPLSYLRSPASRPKRTRVFSRSRTSGPSPSLVDLGRCRTDCAATR